MVLIQKSPDAFQASGVWLTVSGQGCFLGGQMLRICRCQEKKKGSIEAKKKINKQTNIVQKRNLFQAVVKVLEGEHKAESKHTQGSVFSQSLSLEAWTGPLSDLNLQPVCWHVDNTCSYA